MTTDPRLPISAISMRIGHHLYISVHQIFLFMSRPLFKKTEGFTWKIQGSAVFAIFLIFVLLEHTDSFPGKS